MLKHSDRLLIVGILLAAVGCNKAPAPGSDAAEHERASLMANWTLKVDPLAPPTSGTATSSQLTTGGGRAIVSWLEAANFRSTLKFSERTSDGWSEARAVAEGKDFVTNPADVPSVRALDAGTLLAHWNQQYGDDEEAYSLSLSWSKDQGTTWAPAVHPHHDTTKTQHGFGSLFPMPGGGFGVVWLDGRAIREGAPESANNMALRAAVFDASGSQTNEVEIDPRVCDCCQTSVAETPTGVIVAYRDRSPEEVRDIVIARLENGKWSGPTPVHADGWTINGCPVNGPAIDVKGGKAVVAWFTAASGDGQALVAFSSDEGRTFAAPIRVDEGQARGHLDVALLPDNSAVVSWTAADTGHSVFNARRVTPSGSKSEPVTIAAVASTEYPRMTRGKDELLFSWSVLEGGYSRVHTARAQLPTVPTAAK